MNSETSQNENTPTENLNNNQEEIIATSENEQNADVEISNDKIEEQKQETEQNTKIDNCNDAELKEEKENEQVETKEEDKEVEINENKENNLAINEEKQEENKEEKQEENKEEKKEENNEEKQEEIKEEKQEEIKEEKQEENKEEENEVQINENKENNLEINEEKQEENKKEKQVQIEEEEEKEIASLSNNNIEEPQKDNNTIPEIIISGQTKSNESKNNNNITPVDNNVNKETEKSPSHVVQQSNSFKDRLKLFIDNKPSPQSPIQANFSKPSQSLLNKIPAQLLEMNFSQMEQKYKTLKDTPPESNQTSLENISPLPLPPSDSSTQTGLVIQTTKVPYSVSNPSFCEGFFITGISKDKAGVIENSEHYVPVCGHQLCKSLPAMQPEILYRYPKNDTKSLEINSVAASICFPNGIKICYEENDSLSTLKNYSSSITNASGGRFYITTYHFYLKCSNAEFITNYSMHPIKYQTMKFCNDYYEEINTNEKLQQEIQKKLEEYCQLNYKDVVYLPMCMCLISKYPYINQMERCLEGVKQALSDNQMEGQQFQEMIEYLVKGIPIPPLYSIVQFSIPYFAEPIEISAPNVNDLSLFVDGLEKLLQIFSIENIVYIFRLLLFEQKLLFVDDQYERISFVINCFVSLLYPYQWIHTLIPIMSYQMLKYLQSFLPFLNGIHTSLFEDAKSVLEEADEGVFIIYINKNIIDINSNLAGKPIKIKNKM